jgi:hypothetical protein
MRDQAGEACAINDTSVDDRTRVHAMKAAPTLEATGLDTILTIAARVTTDEARNIFKCR